jgi:protein-S-isoprenylcysteine O-methyltransferase Ste14
MLIAVPTTALAIGSWVALIPAAAFCLMIWKRVRAEEEFLQKSLAGYSEYIGRVRGRLFPRVDFHRHTFRHSVCIAFASQDPDRRWP